ncbi:MAG: DUF2461 domain-containing protein [Oscillospiraceae bacterium]|nr:DUF2461 domain-containing protein [Oscillospiraceae bacterium]
MPFSAKSLDFLFENTLNDSKVWFNEHKEDYKQNIVLPFAKLVTDLTDTMLEIDPDFICDPKKISRLYRDARYSKGKSIFRDYVWYSFSRSREAYDHPGFYFSISPNGFDYGCGYYTASTETMNILRGLILNDDKVWKAALKAYKGQSVFELYGDMYKRDRYPEESPERKNWLNRRQIGLSCESKDFQLLFSDRLAEKVAEDFKSIAPIYKLFITASGEAPAGRVYPHP